ncbi:hypothetical protein AO715_05550 [Xanthomonas sp. Mitacek01]|nr:hypothetical protein AO715_05550 [Xanthomonas sp. Mitacek01]
MRRRAVLGAIGALALAPAYAYAGHDEDALLDAIDLDGAPGAAIGVVRAGRIVVLGGRGRRGPFDARTPGADTVFEIGSLTKTFTACLVFALAADGLLDIDAPIAAYVDDLPPTWRDRSLASLLAHTGGLPEYLDATNFRTLMPQALTPREIVAIAADRPLAFAAGTRHVYSNTGYVLLGMAAEAVGGASYWTQLDTRFFRPAGMTRTGPRTQVQAGDDVATGRFWTGVDWDDVPPPAAPSATFSAGGLVSTARDLARWAIALDAGQLVDASTRARMWRRASLADGTAIDWGLGWKIEGSSERPVVAHGGGTAGFSCWFRRDIAARLTTIVLTNQNGRADPALMSDALEAALQSQSR